MHICVIYTYYIYIYVLYIYIYWCPSHINCYYVSTHILANNLCANSPSDKTTIQKHITNPSFLIGKRGLVRNTCE